MRDLAGSTGLAPKLAEAGWEAIPAQSQDRRYTVNTTDFRATTTRRRYRLPTMTSNPRWWWDACEILLPNCHPTHTLTQSGKARTAKSKSRTRRRPPPLQQGCFTLRLTNASQTRTETGRWCARNCMCTAAWVLQKQAQQSTWSFILESKQTLCCSEGFEELLSCAIFRSQGTQRASNPHEVLWRPRHQGLVVLPKNCTGGTDRRLGVAHSGRSATELAR